MEVSTLSQKNVDILKSTENWMWKVFSPDVWIELDIHTFLINFGVKSGELKDKYGRRFSVWKKEGKFNLPLSIFSGAQYHRLERMYVDVCRLSAVDTR